MVRLRSIERRDLGPTRQWANDPALMQLMDRAWPVSDVEHERWFEQLANNKDRAYFAIDDRRTGKHVGNVWLWQIDWRHRRAEVRIVLGETSVAPPGSGTESIDLVSRYAFEKLNLHKLISYVLETNPRARKSFEKAQFQLEGTLKADRWVNDRYVDVYVLGRRHGD